MTEPYKRDGVTVTWPRIVLNFGVTGGRINNATMTLTEALNLRSLLNEGINMYVQQYGDKDPVPRD